MEEITFDDFKNKIQKFQGKDLYLLIKTMIKATIIIEKCKIVINNYRIVFTDGKELDIEIDVEPISKVESSKYGNVFELKCDVGERITLDFDPNS